MVAHGAGAQECPGPPRIGGVEVSRTRRESCGGFLSDGVGSKMLKTHCQFVLGKFSTAEAGSGRARERGRHQVCQADPYSEDFVEALKAQFANRRLLRVRRESCGALHGTATAEASTSA